MDSEESIDLSEEKKGQVTRLFVGPFFFKFLNNLSTLLSMRVKISNSEILQWLTIRISKLTNIQMQNGRTQESLQQKIEIESLGIHSYQKAKYENWQNSDFWNFDSFPNCKNDENLFIFQVSLFLKIANFSIWTIPKILSLENSENV